MYGEKCLKNIMFLFIETWLPFIFATLMSLGLIFAIPLYKIGIDFFYNYLEHFTKNASEMMSTITTICAFFSGVVLTTLTVFGSSVSHSIVKLSENKGAIKKLILSASCALGGCLIIPVLGLFPNISIRMYLILFTLTISFLWSYVFVSIAMFYLNLMNIKEDKQSGESLLGEIRIMKRLLKNYIENQERRQ